MEKKKLQTISLNKIGVDDSFWGKYISLVTKEIIPGGRPGRRDV